MDKQLFDDAIGEVPPSTVDVDAAIARGRRAARVRQMANPAVATGVAVVLLTGAVAYTMTRDDDGSPAVGVAAPTTTTSSAPPSSRTAPPPPTGTSSASTDVVGVPVGGDAVPPPACEREDLESAGEAADRLLQAATDAVMAQRPDLALSPNHEYPKGTTRGPLEFYQIVEPGEELPICDAQGRLESTATTTAPDGDGNLLMLVEPDFHPDERGSCDGIGLPNRTFCAAETGPNGEEIVKQTVGFEGGVVMHRVVAVRDDGTSILVQAENVATSSKYNTPATATAPPLTLDQLVEIAIDPAMTLFP
ncbi:hypothetical protein [Actinophytocola sp. NPDC049390]|uniref:hypothetical protein n=1 Tax=Actinophytocola sp. NPDC049390 TaxID=3363894 RepID=UPI003788172C